MKMERNQSNGQFRVYGEYWKSLRLINWSPIIENTMDMDMKPHRYWTKEWAHLKPLYTKPCICPTKFAIVDVIWISSSAWNRPPKCSDLTSNVLCLPKIVSARIFMSKVWMRLALVKIDNEVAIFFFSSFYISLRTFHLHDSLLFFISIKFVDDWYLVFWKYISRAV